jgi:hypothetical protein
MIHLNMGTHKVLVSRGKADHEMSGDAHQSPTKNQSREQLQKTNKTLTLSTSALSPRADAPNSRRHPESQAALSIPPNRTLYDQVLRPVYNSG